MVLHAHLPYVRHPEYASFFEENWLFEALTECYIPLLEMLHRLQRDQVAFNLTLSLSPTLINMLDDELLRERYVAHLQALIQLADSEIRRTRKEPELHRLARLYRRFFSRTLQQFCEHYHHDVLSGFERFSQSGHLELMTSAATHGFLPLLNHSETAVRNQIGIGIEVFQARFNRQPRGFWLPECAYYPGLEDILYEHGIAYCFTDSHGVLNASQHPVRGVHAPLDCGNGVHVFARNPEASTQVWSADEGYPGDSEYREYYSDIGLDESLSVDYLSPYILDGTTRVQTGIKYHRITSADSQIRKQAYRPRYALRKAKVHAADFVSTCQKQIDQIDNTIQRPPVIVAPYDAELFGHWWFEGPHWLEQVMRLTGRQESKIQAAHCDNYLQHYPDNQIAKPSASTWGDQGYNAYWINERNDWIYPHLRDAINKTENLALKFVDCKRHSLQERAINQAVRSLLLAQASDWPFILKSGTTVEYATKRLTDHLARFNYLHDTILSNTIDEYTLSGLEQMDRVFPDLDFRDFRPRHIK